MTKIKFHDSVTQEEKNIIIEEEEILVSIQTSVEKERNYFDNELKNMKQRFIDAREATIGAEETDLPSLYEQMEREIHLAKRARPQPLPSQQAPYFGRITLEEENKRRTVLLGYSSFLGGKSKYPIVDWRNAPLAKVFFESREGEEFEQELPGRIAEGIVLHRHVLVIENGELIKIQMEEKSLHKINGIWKKIKVEEHFSGGEGQSVQCVNDISYIGVGEQNKVSAEISALLDQNQYDILKHNPDDPLLILGGAGSGKTTVALHRIASINFKNPKQYAPHKCGIIVPEKGLANLTHNLLKRMKIEGVHIETYDEWIIKLGKKLFKKEIKKISPQTHPAVINFKRHPAIMQVAKEFFEKKKKTDSRWNPLKDLKELHFEFFTTPENLERCIELSQGQLQKSNKQDIMVHTFTQHRKLEEEYDGIDISQVAGLDGMSIVIDTDEELAGTFDIEDIPIFLFFYERQNSEKKSKQTPFQYNHLTIDEAQELSPIELKAVGHTLNGSSISISGDASQLTDMNATFESWDQTAEYLGVSAISSHCLETNYRCTIPVTALAKHVLAHLAINLPISKRSGKPVIISNYKQFSIAIIDMIEKLQNLTAKEPRATIAIVLKNEINCHKFFDYLKDDLNLRLVLNGDFSFKPGIDITTINHVKGLEFDYVIIPDCDTATYPELDHCRRDLYVAITRAIHQLWIINTSNISPLVREFSHEFSTS